MERNEQETVVATVATDTVVEITTAQRRHLNALRRHPAFTEVRSGVYDGTEWATFTIPANEWDPASGGKRRRNVSPEARKAAAERLKNARS